jgi:sulfur transfer complex TusBCD TusB component (DsrH family)
VAHYIFIESRAPSESGAWGFVAETAIRLQKPGNDVCVFLVQNGVFGARSEVKGAYIDRLAAAGIRILADDFSLQERGIGPSVRNPKVQQSNIGDLVDMLVSANTKAVWH